MTEDEKKKTMTQIILSLEKDKIAEKSCEGNSQLISVIIQ